MREQPALARDDALAMAFLTALALALPVAIAAVSAERAGLALSSLGVYHDGHLYIEIARSFPWPYAAEGASYVGQAPGYPALIALVHAVTPDVWVDWGMAALLAAWLPAAACAPAFYALCRAMGWAPFWPALLFVVANPRWVSLAATPHTEPLAVLFAVLCLTAWARGRLGASAGWLSAAALTRFPALLLGAPLAFDVLVLRRQRDLRRWLWLALPLIAFAAHNLYLALRVPGFSGIWGAHQVFWKASFTWPFAHFFDPVGTWQFLSGTAAFWLTYASLGFYLVAIAVGARRSQAERRMLALWVAVLVLFHVSLAGYIGAWDFTRLVILAWPAALVLVWSPLAPRLPAWGAGGLALAGGVLSVWFALGQTATAIGYQSRAQDYLRDAIERLHEDEPHWIDFERLEREPR